MAARKRKQQRVTVTKETFMKMLAATVEDGFNQIAVDMRHVGYTEMEILALENEIKAYLKHILMIIYRRAPESLVFTDETPKEG